MILWGLKCSWLSISVKCPALSRLSGRHRRGGVRCSRYGLGDCPTGRSCAGAGNSGVRAWQLRAGSWWNSSLIL